MKYKYHKQGHILWSILYGDVPCMVVCKHFKQITHFIASELNLQQVKSVCISTLQSTKSLSVLDLCTFVLYVLCMPLYSHKKIHLQPPSSSYFILCYATSYFYYVSIRQSFFFFLPHRQYVFQPLTMNK